MVRNRSLQIDPNGLEPLVGFPYRQSQRNGPSAPWKTRFHLQFFGLVPCRHVPKTAHVTVTWPSNHAGGCQINRLARRCSITVWLNEESGHPSPGKTLGEWHVTAVKSILDSA